MGEFVRGHSNPELADQPNRYGEDNYVPQPQGRSYDRHQRSSTSTAVHGGGNITAARDGLGNAVPLPNITDDTIVSIAGIGDMTYLSAKQAGFIGSQQVAPEAASVNPPQPVEAGAADHGGTEPTEANPSDGTEESLADAGAEATITAFAQAADGETQEALIDAAASSSLTDETLQLLTKGVGSPEEVQAARTALEGQAMEAISAATGLQGGDLQQFVSGLYTEHPEAMSSAIRKHLQERNTTAYRDLAAAVLLANADLSEGLPEAGPGVSVREHLGQVVVGIAGNEYRLQDAVRLGLVKISNA